MPDHPSLLRRVLMTADTVGGVWTYALELARALGKQGVDVALATMGAPLTPAQHQEVRQVPRLEVWASTYRLEWMPDPWADVERAGEWLLELEERVQPDVVHLNGYAHGALPWSAPSLVVGHSCVLSWWQAVRGAAAPAEWDCYRERVQRGLQAAGLVVAPSQAMLSALEHDYGSLPDTRVVPNGRDPDLFAPGVKEEFVLAVGRLWDEAKNVAALERVASHLSWPVYVAGEEQHPDGSTPYLGGVRRLGRLSARDLAPWFARAAIYALPARYEPFGLSALEAGLAGCALVLGDIPSLREVWGDAALFVPPQDTEALRDTLQALMTDRERREMLGTRARVRALEFTPERMAAGYVAAYREVRRRLLSGERRALGCPPLAGGSFTVASTPIPSPSSGMPPACRGEGSRSPLPAPPGPTEAPAKPEGFGSGAVETNVNLPPASGGHPKKEGRGAGVEANVNLPPASGGHPGREPDAGVEASVNLPPASGGHPERPEGVLPCGS